MGGEILVMVVEVAVEVAEEVLFRKGLERIKRMRRRRKGRTQEHRWSIH